MSLKNLNHKIFNRRNLFYFVVLAFACWLFFNLFRGGVNAPSHKQDRIEIRQQQQDLKAADQAASTDSARWKKRGDSLERELKVAHSQIRGLKDQLATGAKKAKGISQAISQAKADQDTAGIIRACDSLQNLVDHHVGVISEYEKVTDEMFQTYGQALAAKDSIISTQAELLSKFRSANLSLETKYNELSTDYAKVVRKAKQGRTTNRLLAAGALVLGGLLLSK